MKGMISSLINATMEEDILLSRVFFFVHFCTCRTRVTKIRLELPVVHKDNITGERNFEKKDVKERRGEEKKIV